MKFYIEPKLFEEHPNLKVGVVLVKGFDNSRRNSSVESLLRGICAQKTREYSDTDLDSLDAIKCWNEAYVNFGINPKKYSPSIKSLLKRVSQGKEIPHVNALVDIYNYFSLKYGLPVGAENLDWLCGNLRLTYTKGGEAFRPLGSIDVKEAREGEVAYLDDGGITCRYWNYKECERTKLTEKTVNAAIIIEDLSDMHMDKFGGILREMQNAIIKYLGGQIEPYIMTKDSPAIEIGVEGRPSADDSKVTNQEKAYYLERHQS